MRILILIACFSVFLSSAGCTGSGNNRQIGSASGPEYVIAIHGGAGGTGGVLAVNRFVNVSMPFNTSGMYRGYIKSTCEKKIAIFRE